MTKNAKVKWAAAAMVAAGLLLGACKSQAPTGKEIESHRAGGLVLTLRNDKGDLTQGQNQFVVEFRSAADNKPVDAGHVSVNSTMAMPGMALIAAIEVQPGDAKGQYLAKGSFSMSGSWHFEVHWDGPAGQGSTTFNTNVR
ncbi:MAG TPA: hypothetical protein DEQ47_10035 [Solibacterales bacterium]|nr:hypothetical protein [Bryobacterales bacterium]